MTKKLGFYLMIPLFIALGIYFFFQKQIETPYVFNKSAIRNTIGKNQGQFIPEEKTNHIFVHTDSGYWLNVKHVVILIIILLCLIFLIIIKKPKKY